MNDSRVRDRLDALDDEIDKVNRDRYAAVEQQDYEAAARHRDKYLEKITEQMLLWGKLKVRRPVLKNRLANLLKNPRYCGMSQPFFTPTESKEVGWDGELIMEYPSMDEVNSADRIQLLKWYRFLVEPKGEQREIVSRIMERLNEGKE